MDRRPHICKTYQAVTCQVRATWAPSNDPQTTSPKGVQGIEDGMVDNPLTVTSGQYPENGENRMDTTF